MLNTSSARVKPGPKSTFSFLRRISTVRAFAECLFLRIRGAGNGAIVTVRRGRWAARVGVPRKKPRRALKGAGG